MTLAWLMCTHHDIDVRTKYGEPWLYGNGDTDLITKFYIVNTSHM